VRELIEQNVASEQTIFRSSARRRLSVRLESMSSEQKNTLNAVRKDSSKVPSTTDPAVLDTLMDEWKYRNYRAKTLLKAKDSVTMESVFNQRAKVTTASMPLPPDSVIAEKYSLIPPYKSHRPVSAKLGGSHLNTKGAQEDEAFISVGAAFGAHLDWQNPQGYFDASVIEYLSFEILYETKVKKWNDSSVLRWAHAKAIEPLSAFEKNWSWQFMFESSQACALCASGGVGGALKFGRAITYFMPMAAATNFKDKDFGHQLAGGYEAGVKHVTPRSLLNFTYQQLFARKEYIQTFDFSGRHLKSRWPLISFKNESSSLGEFKARLGLSFVFD
jgi:hypothetical protein